jgi:hypothetical protein
VGPQTENVGFPSLDKDARLASGLSGVNVAGVQDGSWSHLWFIWHCLAAKSFHVEADVGAVFFDMCCPVPSCCSGRWCLSGGCEAPGIGYFPWCWPSWYLRDWILCGEVCFYQSMLIQCQSYHDNYACPFRRVAMSGGDGMNFSTRVPAARGMWVPAVLSYHARH